MKRSVRIDVAGSMGRWSWPSRRTTARRAAAGWGRRSRTRRRPSRATALGFQALESRIALSANLPTFPDGFVTVGNVAYFSAYDDAHGRELWRTDGTRAGTTLVKDIYEGSEVGWDENDNEILVPNSAAVSRLTAFKGRIFFQATTGSNAGLWTSDGTAQGTQLIKPNVAPPGGGTSSMMVLGDSLFFFVGGDDQGDSGLWKTDGTAEGTQQVWGGIEDAGPLSVVAGRLFFVASVPAEGPVVTRGLFATDGSGSQPELISTFTSPGAGEFGDVEIVGQIGSTVFLSIADDVNGVELWKSDGSAGGTVLVKDINPGTRAEIIDWDENGDPITESVPAGSHPFEVFAIGPGVAVLSASTQTTGRELWRTDGTPGGTVLVKDLVPGSDKYDGQTYPRDSSPGGFTSYAGSTFFTTYDGSLWKTDGTTKGTVLVKKIGVSESAMGEGRYGGQTAPVVLNGRLLYSAYNVKADSWEMWSSDGTGAGSMRLQDLPPTIASVTLPDARTYGAGETLQFTVTFTDAVVVTGKSSLQLTVGKATKLATYVSGSGTNQLVYRYTVGKNDLDTDGIAVASKLVGSITSAASKKVKALLTVPALATAGIRVDASPPAVSSVTAPPSGNYAVGETLAFLVRFNEVVRVTGVPQIAVTFGKTVLQAVYVSGDGTDSLRFEVLADAAAPTGAKVATSIVLPTGAAITDSWGNAAAKLSFKAPVTSGVKVVPQPIDPALYQGQYEGSFGTLASGPISATVVDRTITVAIVVNAPNFGINGVPANGTGTIATDGAFSFTATGGVFGVVFTGQIFLGQDGAVSASGTWKNSRASGTWRVDRISNNPPV